VVSEKTIPPEVPDTARWKLRGGILKVAILAGGESAERDVSLETGRCVAKALMELGHQILPYDTAREGAPLPEDPGLWGAGPATQPPELLAHQGQYRAGVFSAMEAFRRLGAEIIFNALHGGIGEDGTVQGYLDLVGIPYTGSGMLACALAMDKAMAKKVFLQEGLRTPRASTLPEGGQSSASLRKRLVRELGVPLVVKPNNQGSTLGLRVVEDQEDLAGAIEEAARYGGGVLAEEYIPGREITVALLEDRSLPIVEIVPQGGLYDYTCKYTSGRSQYLVDVSLPPGVAAEIQSMSLEAFRALGCYGYARADLRLSPKNVPYLLEVNTLPGMTEHSLVPKAARAEGIFFPQLIEKIVTLALIKKESR
jgi:D-alanine-D-alanine ligase